MRKKFKMVTLMATAAMMVAFAGQSWLIRHQLLRMVKNKNHA